MTDTETEKFQPRGEITFPLVYPYKIHYITPQGDTKTKTILQYSDLPSSYVAVKIDQPNHLENALAVIQKTLPSILRQYPFSTKLIIEALDSEGLLVKVDRQPQTNWLDQKMDSLGIIDHDARSAVEKWFKDPSKPIRHFYLATELRNGILAVEDMRYGRRVVTPQGHSLAYSKAKQIWDSIRGYYNDYLGDKIEAGEMTNHGRNFSRFSYRKYNSGVVIGCQKIPMSAIKDLAERENWR